MSNNTHVTDVGGLVHKGPDLVYGEVTVEIDPIDAIESKGKDISQRDCGKTRGIATSTYTMMSRFY